MYSYSDNKTKNSNRFLTVSNKTKKAVFRDLEPVSWTISSISSWYWASISSPVGGEGEGKEKGEKVIKGENGSMVILSIVRGRKIKESEGKKLSTYLCQSLSHHSGIF